MFQFPLTVYSGVKCPPEGQLLETEGNSLLCSKLSMQGDTIISKVCSSVGDNTLLQVKCPGVTLLWEDEYY